MLFAAEAAIACLLERAVGYPKLLQDSVGHPVQWIGQMINWMDRTFNTAPGDKMSGLLRGGACLLALIICTALPALMIQDLLLRWPAGWLLNALVATAFIAQKSLSDHVLDVKHKLSSSLQDARQSVARIVGRDTSGLNESGVCKAALESLAENTADGIVAPVFWFVLLGLPGIAVYKAINTADSMIGHKSDQYLYFGFAAAKLDDIVNFPAARLTALLFAAAAAWQNVNKGKAALVCAARDASKHRSPNAGWPEAAMAGALGVRFGGPRQYEEGLIDLPWMGTGRETLSRQDIAAGLAIYWRAMWVMAGVLILLAVAL